MSDDPDVPAPQRLPASVLAAVYVLFFVSGFTALVFEVLWSRQFVTVFGNSSYAITTVLCAFMAGLGIGNLLGGRLADRCPERLLAYGAMQAGVGLWALLVPLLLAALRRALPGISSTVSASPPLLFAVRFLASFCVLFVPCVLMGMTLPVLVRYCTQSRAAVGRRVSSLYGLNTLGAAAGCFAAGYVLLGRFGVAATNQIAVALNLLLAMVVVVLRLTRPRHTRPALKPSVPPTDAGTDASPTIAGLLLAVAFLCGLAGLSCQVLWVRFLAFFSTNTAYAFPTILGVFLLGLGLGGIACRALLARFHDPLRLLATVMTLLGITVPVCFAVAAITLAPEHMEQEAVRVLVVAAVAILAPTVLMGMTFPLLCAALGPRVAAVGRSIGRVSAFNTAGSIGGALVPVFLLVPLAGVQNSLLWIAGLYLAAGTAIACTRPGRKRTARAIGAGAGAVVAIVLLAVLIPGNLNQRVFLESNPSLGKHNEIVLWEEGRTAAAVVEKDAIRGLRTLYINRVEEVPTTYGSLYCFKLLAALGPVLHPDPRNVLMICFGGGIAAGATTRYPAVQTLEIVDIEAAVVGAASLFGRENNGVLADPKVNVIVEDGRNYIQASSRRWPVIVSDSTHPKAADSWVLYSREFYVVVQEHLTESGVFVQWLPIHDLSVPEYKIILRTFQSVFPHASVWLTFSLDTAGREIYTMLVATPGPLKIDVRSLAAKLSSPPVAKDLEPFGLHTPAGVLETFVCGEKPLREWVGNGPVNTDDMPWTYYRTRHSGDPCALPVFSELLESAWPYLVNMEEDVSRLKEDMDARLLATRLLLVGRFDEAFRLRPGDPKLGVYREAVERAVDYARAAAQANWDDTAALLSLAETMGNWPGGGPTAESLFRRVLEIKPDHVGARSNLGLVMGQQGKSVEATEHIARALQLDPRNASAHNNMGMVLFMKGRMDEARDHFLQALAADPGLSQAHYHAGLTFASQGSAVEGIPHFRKALAGMPHGVDIHYHLATALIAEGKILEAIEHCRTAVRIDPAFTQARYTLGAYALQLGRPSEAMTHFDEVLRFRPDHPEAQRGLEQAKAMERERR